MSSAVGDTWFGIPIPRDPKCVGTDIHKAFIHAKAMGKGVSKLKMIINVDPHLDYIPQKLINWGMKNVIGLFLTLI